jgi:hypothetical protein
LNKIKSRFDSQIDVSGCDMLDWPGRALTLSLRLLLKRKLRPVDVFSDRLKDCCDMNSKKPSRQIGFCIESVRKLFPLSNDPSGVSSDEFG